MNIKVLRLDNEGDYTSNEFKDLCKDAGIKRDLIVSYNPQQNGVVERNNPSIIGSTRAMMNDHDFPMFLWEEACNTTVYLHNRSPHMILGNTTP